MQVLYLNGYTPGQQYDAHEYLIQLLQKFYPEVNDDWIFKISLLESTMCEGNCRHSTENTFSHTELGLQVEGSVNTETISEPLEKSQNPILLEGYRCDKCGNVGTIRKADLVTHISEIMIFHLELFQYSNKFYAINKITPNLYIQEELSLWGSWKLHGIIYHEGRLAKSGYYTCSIRSNEKWYIISDSLVTAERKVNLRCSSNNFKVPYILLYI